MSMASTVSTNVSLTSALYQASGLASGLNTATIVDALIAADSGRLNALKRRQDDYQVQISTLGTMVSQLQALKTAASTLSTKGVVPIQPDSTYSDFTVTGSARTEGSYAIQVSQMAKEAKMLSKDFTSAQDPAVVDDGMLQFAIDGVNTVAIDTTGKGLADIAEAINNGITGLRASVISTGSAYYLSVARSSTGYSSTSENALTIVSQPNMSLGITQYALNAQLEIDGLPIQRTSNTITDAIGGVTLHLTAESNVRKNVNFTASSSGTEEALQTFVDAYNALATTLRGQLVTDPDQSYGDTLLDHTTVASIQGAVQSMLTKTVVASGSVRTLSDLGLEIQRDGTLELNTIRTLKAVETNPAAVNAIFSNSTQGIATAVSDLAKRHTSALTGTLVMRQKSLQSSIIEMDEQKVRIQSYLDAQRVRLTEQFINMERIISGFNAATSYLTQVANLKIES
jgi:flagellar hook-associated protein 2